MGLDGSSVCRRSLPVRAGRGDAGALVTYELTHKPAFFHDRIQLPHAEQKKVSKAQERRLFHVAMTRAMRRLVVSYPDDAPSQFVADLDRQLWAWETA